jgi:formamidopyrimidine-DNA glycosylase
MPELPDITIYIEALEARLLDQPLERIRLGNPFILRTFEPPLSAAEGKKVVGFQRIGKRIVFELEGELFLVFHLMITGRFHWKKRGIVVPRKYGHAAFDFPMATLLLTEMGTKKRASLHLVQGREHLQEHDPGGLEIFAADVNSFRAVVRRENHTLKRALTDPHLFSGIGNAYSDEILHRAKLSPVKQTKLLSDDEIDRLFHATRACMAEWIERLRKDTGKNFPERVTAFRDDMAVHGKYRKPCPMCGAQVQRIVYAENETNYCANCQTGGKLLADRSLSRLLKDDWPRTLEEMEEGRRS